MDNEWKVLSEKLLSKNTLETVYISTKSKKPKTFRLVYHYNEPKNEEEAKEQQRNVDAAYDILFEAVLRARRGKDSA